MNESNEALAARIVAIARNKEGRAGTSPTPKPVTKPSPRLTVVDKVYFQSPDQAATGIEAAFSANLASDEQPYVRRVKVTNEWQPLDLGWLADHPISMMVIRNDSPAKTPEEKRTAAIELALLSPAPAEPNRDMHSEPKQQDKIVPFAIIPAGQSARWKPVIGVKLLLRRTFVVNGTDSSTLPVPVTLAFFPG